MQDKQKPQIDYKKLTPEQRDKLENYQQAQDQLQVLQDIALMSQEMISLMDDQKKDGGDSSKNMGALLMDMRDSLTTLNEKKAPEPPDYAKPVVAAVRDLEKALSASIKAIDVKPQIDAPQVNISPPSVDLKGVEKAVSGLSKSFQDAVNLIKIPEPEKTDFQPLLDAWEGISEQLLSLENTTRMKPLPGSIRVSNLSDIRTEFVAGVDYDYLVATNTNTDEDTLIKKLGGATGTTVETLVITYATGADKVSDSISTLEWD